MAASKPALSNRSFFISLREAVVLLELQGPSELKPGVSGVHERVSPDPDTAFEPFHPIQFSLQTICAPVRNKVCS